MNKIDKAERVLAGLCTMCTGKAQLFKNLGDKEEE